VDRQEYKILLDEIMELTAEERFQEAAQIADQIDWRKVRKSGTLVQIGDLYRSNFRYEDALDIMLLAYEKNAGSRKIIYNVCELYIELGDIVGALDFLAKYRELAPNATEVYILQYKILELEHADLDTKITLLKELCHKDRTRPEWRYQLAYLLHRAGYATECVEECDKMITWFHNGPFVIKAMELKMLHARLTVAQQAIYNARDEISDEISAYESDEYTVERPDPILGEDDFHVKTIDMSKFNTMNLQKALAESMRELLNDEDSAQNNARITGEIMRPMTEDDYMSTGEMENAEAGYATEDLAQYPEDAEYPEDTYPADAYPADGEYPEDAYPEEEYPEDGTYPEEQYSEDTYPADTYPADAYPADRMDESAGFVEEEEGSTVFINTDKISQMTGPVNSVPEEDPSKRPPAKLEDNEVFFEDRTSDIIIDSPPAGTNPAYESLHQIAEEVRREEGSVLQHGAAAGAGAVSAAAGAAGAAVAAGAAAAGAAAGAATANGDAMVEKDITGQINLDDYMSDWEQRKQRKAEERKQETARKIKENTGKIFAEYAEKQKNGLIGEIEKEHKEFVEKYEDDDIELRSVGEVAAENESRVVQMQTGTLGFVDAAVAAAEGLIQEAQEANDPEADWYEEPAKEADAGSAEPEESKAQEEPVNDAAEEDSAEEVSSGPEEAEAEEEEAPAEEETAEAEEAGAEEQESFEGEEAYAEDADAYAEGDGSYEDEEAYAEEEEPYEGEEDYGEDAAYEDEEIRTQGMSTAQMEEIAGALEADADRIGVETVDEMNDEYVSDGEEADFSPEEKKLFNDFLYSKKMRAQILDTIDNISLAPYVGNVIITGENESELLQLGKVIVKELQMIDSNFISKRVAKISGTKMNQRDIPAMLSQLVNGALLVERAADMVQESVEILMNSLEGMQEGIIVILMDEKREMELMIDESPMLEGYFNTRIDITPMNNNALVEYAKKYAYSREYKIDEERGILALHQRISELQIGEHHVTTREVEDIIEDAIAHSLRPRPSVFFSILGGKRYDYEDMIILKESDFV